MQCFRKTHQSAAPRAPSSKCKCLWKNSWSADGGAEQTCPSAEPMALSPGGEGHTKPHLNTAASGPGYCNKSKHKKSQITIYIP